ncbi:head GIN domain-containing protein [Sunxiuqinia sp. A32]|uniref:head GIN domain-containing protein n=1 Tax=Sunxiuqinia sp. A32 TaxID=3461496 RepID=UPI00404546F9
MKYFGFSIFFLFMGLIFSQANAMSEWDDDEVRTYEVADFNRIHLEGGYRIILEQSDTPTLKIRTDEEAFRYIDVDSDNETLELSITKDHFDFERIELYITFKDLKELYIEGGANLETRGYLDLTQLDIHVEGGAKIEMELKVDELNVLGEGGVMFEFEGVAHRLDARISGAGHLDAENLRAEYVAFEIEGVGAGSVYATEKLRATIEGVGKIKYKGNPDVDKTIEGVGFVSKD